MSEIDLGEGFHLESTCVFIGEGKKQQLAARITIQFWPGFCDNWMIQDVLENGASRLAEHIKDSFNELEKYKS